MIRRRGGSLSIVHTHRGAGRLRTDYLATVGADGCLTPAIRAAAEAKAQALGLSVTFDWPKLEAQATVRVQEAQAYRAERGLRQRSRADLEATVAELEQRVGSLESEVVALRTFAREAVELMGRRWELPSAWTRRGRFDEP